VTVATSALYTVPVAAFVIGVLFLRETPPASALLGGLIAIAGVALVQLLGRPTVSASAPVPASAEIPQEIPVEA
jgi:drug/metabolite transporter (DMT)-like permease